MRRSTSSSGARRFDERPEWLQVGRARRARARLDAAPRCLPGQGVRRGAVRRAIGCSSRSSARSTALSGVDPEREQRWNVYAVSLLAFSAISVLGLYLRSSASRARCRSTRPTSTGVPPALVVQHRGQLRHEHELAELRRRVDDEPPHPDGRAGGAELRLGGGRHRRRGRADPRPRPATQRARSGTSGSTSTRTTTRVLLPLAFVVRARASSSQGVVQNFHGPRRHHGRGRAARRSPAGPIASQEAIKELGTNGGGPYNANSAHPFENPNAVHEPAPDLALLLIPFALTYTFGRLVEGPAQGWVVFAAMFVALARRGAASRCRSSRTATRRLDSASARPAGGNMEGKEVRFGPAASASSPRSTTGTSTGAVNARARQLHAARRRGPARQHDVGEVSPGGVGVGPLRDADLRAARGVHRRPDGRPNARVPRQEDPGAEMKLVVLYILVVPLADPRLRGDRRCCSSTAQVVDPQPRPARPLRDRLRLHVRGEQQRLGVRRPDRQHRLVQHDARPRHARRALPAHRPGARDRRLAGAQAAGPGIGRDVPDRHAAVRRPARRRRRSSSSASRTSPSLALVGTDRLEHLPTLDETRPSSAPSSTRKRSARCSTARSSRRASRQLREARPAPDGAQPGHVRRRGRQRARHGPLLRPSARRHRQRLRRRSSRSGSGSPSCSRTSPRRWPRAAARRRPTTLRKTRSETIAPSPRVRTARSRTCRARASRRRRGRRRRRAR